MYLKNINLKRLKQLVSPLLILLVLVLPVAVVSCEDMMGNYLEKPPGGDVTEDTIFFIENTSGDILNEYLSDGYPF